MNILFLVRTLNSGGAERQLVNLAKGLENKGHNVSVAVLYSGGVLQSDLEDAGVSVFLLKKKHRWDVFSFFFSLIQLVKKIRPEIIHGYGSVPNCLTVIVKLFLYGKINAVWGVRASFLDLSQEDTFTRVMYKVECFLSRFADLIIINSSAGRDYAIANGFSKQKMEVVYNGIDTNIFRPNVDARLALRSQWKINADILLVGFVGRLDLMKDHPTFIEAMKDVTAQKKNVMAVCIGGNEGNYFDELQMQVTELNLTDNFLWFFSRQDIVDCMNAFDIFVSSSYGEGFPNVIGEAMACGLPCVVTDVGDSAHVVGSCGLVVQPQNSKELALAIVKLLEQVDKTQDKLTICTRKRIVENFNLDKLVEHSEICLNDVIH